MYVKSTHLMFARVATHNLLASRSLCPQFHEQSIITALLSHTCGTFFLFSEKVDLSCRIFPLQAKIWRCKAAVCWGGGLMSCGGAGGSLQAQGGQNHGPPAGVGSCLLCLQETQASAACPGLLTAAETWIMRLPCLAFLWRNLVWNLFSFSLFPFLKYFKIQRTWHTIAHPCSQYHFNC